MRDIFRYSAVGQWIRLLRGKQLARYPEEFSGFKLPTEYSQEKQFETDQTDNSAPRTVIEMEEGRSQTVLLSDEDAPRVSNDIENNITLVTWYSDDDPDNPHNWSFLKKIWIAFLLLVYTISVYIGSSVYTASEPDVVSIFGVNDTAAALGLSLYVIVYGIGPLLFASLSEMPAIGRNPPYIYTYIIFVSLCVAAALVDNFGGLIVLRFLLGVFGSPCLAHAGASYGDFFGPREMPYAIALWGGGATLSPALGSLVGGFAVQSENWRWSSWELLWISGPTLLAVLISLPETSSDANSLRRAKRLRELTGRSDLKSASEIRQAQMSPQQIVFDALIKAWEINILDPAMLFTTVYTALTYGLYYSFFESFPLVYRDIYGFNLGQLGLAFLAVLIGLVVGVVVYCAYFYYVADPRMAKMESVPPEARLWPGLIASFLLPIGLFIFGNSTSFYRDFILGYLHVESSLDSSKINPLDCQSRWRFDRQSVFLLRSWFTLIVLTFLVVCGVFIIIQCMFIYLPFTYPRYTGSLFAANGFARSTFAAAAILFAEPMFSRLGVNGGVSLLGGLTVLCILGIYGIYFGGAILRKKSKFAVS